MFGKNKILQRPCHVFSIPCTHKLSFTLYSAAFHVSVYCLPLSTAICISRSLVRSVKQHLPASWTLSASVRLSWVLSGCCHLYHTQTSPGAWWHCAMKASRSRILEDLRLDINVEFFGGVYFIFFFFFFNQISDTWDLLRSDWSKTLIFFRSIV